MDEEKLKASLGFLEELMTGTIDVLPEHIGNPIKKILEFRKTLNSETDRGCALMAAAYIDEKLGELLKAYLVDDPKIIERMFDFNGPFGTFSSRIDSTYSLGLLPGNVYKDIHLLRKIRNDFAHVSTPLTFDDEPISSRCRELNLDGKHNTSKPRGKFTRAMMAALGVIELSTQQVNRCSAMPDHDISLNQRGVDTLREYLRNNGMGELVDLV
ncbi:MltR family transcriptional regulator [Vibrio cholerae]|uniref:MltR family transcriptional regulator n=1 Tax=Vibrio cholerae TaxID=666 RepID=UPI00208955AB|nr:MltR family transcriptional regulator [Vibrio cholerae]EGR3934234.1 hypothetical protein [Vibrio cholerae]EJL6898242.1 hypothetical protein [Vibrio cholerae]EKF6145183.1 hypothetical protein [Vibrio cholerae]EKF9619877.1 hypothetical protein [Vibrio cholerae]ELE0371146.1 hypothetical protein [Vibrio cholerae]